MVENQEDLNLDMNGILDKINKSGMRSLNSRELGFLKEMSNKSK